MRLKFGDYVFDHGTRQVRRGEEVCHLGPTAFELLSLLLLHRPNVVRKEAIHDHLWPGTFVSGSTLATVVAEVRTALDDDAKHPRFLRTVHGVGYAFCGEATPAEKAQSRAPAGPVRYHLLFDDREIPLCPGENLLGRVDESILWIDSPSVSRRHARIRVDDAGATLEDLGSRNGTFCRGERISGLVPLSNGDEIRLGNVTLRLRILRTEPTTETGG